MESGNTYEAKLVFLERERPEKSEESELLRQFEGCWFATFEISQTKKRNSGEVLTFWGGRREKMGKKRVGTESRRWVMMTVVGRSCC
eukprot:538119-Amorphochlora_amoeboformis.AAC.1